MTSIFGEVRYPVPKVGAHGTISCFFGKHWLALARAPNGHPVGILCPPCGKSMEIHDLPFRLEADKEET